MAAETKEIDGEKYTLSDFGSDSNPPTEPIELIAVEIPAFMGNEYIVMVNNGHLSADEISAGKGSSNPYLHTHEYTDRYGERKVSRTSDNSYEFHPSSELKKDSLRLDGYNYIPFRAKVVPEKLTSPNKGILNETIGYTIDFASVETSAYGKLTEKDIDNHLSNTKAIYELSQCHDKVQETQKASAIAERQVETKSTVTEKEPVYYVEAKSVETEGKSKQQKDYLIGDFGKRFGNSIYNVELIAVMRPGRFAPGGYNAYVEDDNPYRAIGNENGRGPKIKPEVAFIEVMANNSQLSEADIKAGKGHEFPNLYTHVKQGKTYEHSFPVEISQYQDIMEKGGAKAFTEKDGTRYVPFKADIVPYTKPVKDADGKPVMGEDGKPKREMIGYKPNMTTLRSTEFGALTKEDIDKQYSNTSALHKVKSEYRAKAKSAKLNYSSTMSSSIEQSVSEIETESSLK